jgi:hypothetical protein
MRFEISNSVNLKLEISTRRDLKSLGFEIAFVLPLCFSAFPPKKNIKEKR